MKFLNTPLSGLAQTIWLIAFGVLLLAITGFLKRCATENDKHPWQVGQHYGYEVICTNNYLYQIIRFRESIESIQIMNSDGTPATCDMPVY